MKKIKPSRAIFLSIVTPTSTYIHDDIDLHQRFISVAHVNYIC